MTPTNGDLTGLKILGFCDHFTESSQGGVEIVTAEIYRRLAAAGADIRLVTGIPNAKEAQTEVHGISTFVVPSRDLSAYLGVQLGVSGKIFGVARRVAAQFEPDVVHVSGLQFEGSVAGTVAARRLSLPLVASAHVGSSSALGAATRFAADLYEQTVGRFMASSADRLIAVSEPVADHLRSLGARNVTVIPNGVDSDRFAPGEKDPDHPHVVFLGRLISNKGPVEALNAFAAAGVKEARMTFVGDGPLRPHVDNRARSLGVRDQVEFAKSVVDPAPILATADVFIRPSRNEGAVPLAALEGMAAGAAALLTDLAEVRESVSDDESAVLVRFGNASRLAAELRSLLTDQDRRRRIAEGGRAVALARSWEECAQSTGAVLREAAGKD